MTRCAIPGRPYASRATLESDDAGAERSRHEIDETFSRLDAFFIR